DLCGSGIVLYCPIALYTCCRARSRIILGGRICTRLRVLRIRGSAGELRRGAHALTRYPFCADCRFEFGSRAVSVDSSCLHWCLAKPRELSTTTGRCEPDFSRHSRTSDHLGRSTSINLRDTECDHACVYAFAVCDGEPGPTAGAACACA